MAEVIPKPEEKKICWFPRKTILPKMAKKEEILAAARREIIEFKKDPHITVIDDSRIFDNGIEVVYISKRLATAST